MYLNISFLYFLIEVYVHKRCKIWKNISVKVMEVKASNYFWDAYIFNKAIGYLKKENTNSYTKQSHQQASVCLPPPKKTNTTPQNKQNQ